MELESIMLSEISQSEKDKYRMISLLCGIKKQKQMSKGEKERQTGKHTLHYREHTGGSHRGGGWGCV